MKKFSLKSHSTNSSPFWTFFSAIIAVNLMIFLSGCVSLPKSTEKSQKISRAIEGKGILSSSELSSYFLSQNPSYNKKSIQNLSALYISEAKTEGINSDVAFAQMCLETGYLRFGNLVVPEMHNYCGLGAIDKEHPGEWFKTEQEGVRAHIQHLHAYATTSEKTLKNPLIDKRYKWVNPRGKAPTIFYLAGTWAADKEYGNKLDKILDNMENFRK